MDNDRQCNRRHCQRWIEGERWVCNRSSSFFHRYSCNRRSSLLLDAKRVSRWMHLEHWTSPAACRHWIDYWFFRSWWCWNGRFDRDACSTLRSRTTDDNETYWYQVARSDRIRLRWPRRKSMTTTRPWCSIYLDGFSQIATFELRIEKKMITSGSCSTSNKWEPSVRLVTKVFSPLTQYLSSSSLLSVVVDDRLTAASKSYTVRLKADGG